MHFARSIGVAAAIVATTGVTSAGVSTAAAGGVAGTAAATVLGLASCSAASATLWGGVATFLIEGLFALRENKFLSTIAACQGLIAHVLLKTFSCIGESKHIEMK